MAFPDSIRFHSLAHSRSGPHESTLQRWWDDTQRELVKHVPGKKHGVTLINSAMHGGEGMFIGAFLAMLHVELPKGLDTFGPIDLIGGTASLLLSAAPGIDQAKSEYLRTAGACAWTAWGLRKGYAFAAERALAAGKKPGGTFAGEGETIRAFGGAKDADEKDEFIVALRELAQKQ